MAEITGAKTQVVLALQSSEDLIPFAETAQTIICNS